MPAVDALVMAMTVFMGADGVKTPDEYHLFIARSLGGSEYVKAGGELRAVQASSCQPPLRCAARLRFAGRFQVTNTENHALLGT